jgi:hypothetical protein
MDNQDEEELLAKGLQAMERLNKSVFGPAGHKLEAVKQPDGSSQIVDKQIWSDEEIESKKQESSKAILEGVGRTLLDDTSMQAQLLLAFLQDAYRANADKELETTQEIGHALLACLETAKQDPTSDFVKTFTILNDAWMKLEAERGS